MLVRTFGNLVVIEAFNGTVQYLGQLSSVLDFRTDLSFELYTLLNKNLCLNFFTAVVWQK